MTMEAVAMPCDHVSFDTLYPVLSILSEHALLWSPLYRHGEQMYSGSRLHLNHVQLALCGSKWAMEIVDVYIYIYFY